MSGRAASITTSRRSPNSAKAVIDLHAEVFARRLSGSPAATPAQKLHAIPDAIGAIQTALEAQFGRAVGCPFGNFAAELSTTDDDLRTHLAGKLGAMERHLARRATTRPRPAFCGTAPIRTGSPTHFWRSTRASSCSPSSTIPASMRSRPHCTTSSTATSSNETELGSKFGRKVMRNFSVGSTPTPAVRAPTTPTPGRDATPRPSPRG